MSPSYSREDKIFLQNIGKRIRQLRIGASLSQEQLAFTCELDRTYIGSVERGERNISALNLKKIAQALKIEPADILDI